MTLSELSSVPPPRAFGQLLEMLREPSATAPIVSPRRFSIAFSMDLQSLAEVSRVHLNTITRDPESNRLQAYMRDALRVICAATDVAGGDVQRALFWYRNAPIDIFSYTTAEQLVSDGRANDVVRYVVSMKAGAAG